MDIKKELKKFEFQKKGIITLNEKQTLPKLELLEFKDDLEGNVYLWIAETDNKMDEIIYVGKAGRTMSKRIKEM